MHDILHITNGDATVDIMRRARLSGDFLPWRDVLHEGPVADGPDLASLSERRARFIAHRGWGDAEQVLRDFKARDSVLKSAGSYARIILWFEHDLYDQLQILQILHWLDAHPLPGTRVSMICTQNYLGMLSPDELLDLKQFEQTVTRDQLRLAAEAWSAFRAGTPKPWHGLLNTDTTALPFLRPAVIRMLEEYPSCANGLSRSAHQALDIISRGEGRPAAVFAGSQALEARRFMGDTVFWTILEEMLTSDPPLLKLPAGRKLTLPPDGGQTLTITSTGSEVLAGSINWLDLKALDRWIGGVHLRPGHLWCWDGRSPQPCPDG